MFYCEHFMKIVLIYLKYSHTLSSRTLNSLSLCVIICEFIRIINSLRYGVVTWSGLIRIPCVKILLLHTIWLTTLATKFKRLFRRTFWFHFSLFPTVSNCSHVWALIKRTKFQFKYHKIRGDFWKKLLFLIKWRNHIQSWGKS